MEQGLCLVCGIIAVYHVPLERGLYFFANQDKLARYNCGIVNVLPWNKDLALSAESSRHIFTCLERGLYFFAYQDKLALYHCGIVNALPWNKDLALSVYLAGGLNYSLANQNKLALYHPVSSNYPMWYFALSSLGLYFFAHQDKLVRNPPVHCNVGLIPSESKCSLFQVIRFSGFKAFISGPEHYVPAHFNFRPWTLISHSIPE